MVADAGKEHEDKTEGVLARTFNYLNKFCDSIDKIQQEKELQRLQSTGLNYKKYLPPDVLEAGIKSGQYIEGIVNVSRQ